MVPFVKDSDTSERAAFEKVPTRLRDEARVLAHITASGGATDQETEAALGMIHETASARRHALRQKGFVRDSGLRRKTPRGRDAVVWIVGSDLATIGTKNDRSARPSASAIRGAAETMRRLSGAGVGADYMIVLRWLRWLGEVEK